jgi:F-type H+-transporting ATPase subunit gamma
MSNRYSELAARIDSIGQLRTVVGAMRGIAAAHVQRSRGCLAGVHAYADTVANAIAHALALMPDIPPTPQQRDGHALLVLFCAEQGFAGTFTERVFDTAGSEALRARLLLIGRRGMRIAAARGLEPDMCIPAIAHVNAAAALADRIAAELLHRLDTNPSKRATIIYTRPQDSSNLVIERVSLLPLDLRRFGRALDRPPPLVQLEPALLLQRLAMEYLRAQLTEAILHSFAAENTARMLAMTAARDNIAHTLDTLRHEASIARQEAITEEVVELALGRIDPAIKTR